ncbi:Ig-like domain repeat protein [Demequina zhanjiangensis]|uniref:Ig-like domain repeat protein n=1 Tax=Demequina zhanjiangensis TaxID=3051659 RepID=A0ABT8G0L4_9MICO|nr:Ig-like domain repeat protein [Demequina sp. SYSU T00b26]MDN4472552.1 Ig-like domain repeat protein [Demequina sp. SYSU T00b26]
MGSHDTARRRTAPKSPHVRGIVSARVPVLRRARPAISAALALALASAGLATASADTWDGSVSGELLEVIIETDGSPTEEHVVVADDGEVSRVQGEVLDQIDPGSTVEVTVSGADVESATVLGPASETVALSAHHAYVVAIDDPSASGDVALSSAVANTEYAADYWVREARGAITGFDVADSTTLTWSGSCSATYSQLWSTAAAEFPGVSFSGSGNHLIVYTPSACSYSYAGVATVGSMPAGGYVHISSLSPSTTVHELGHNLGLGHSNALWGDPYGAYGFAEYYGVYGPQAGSIGSLQPGALDAAYRAFLDLPGWQSQTETVTVDPELREERTLTLTETTSGTGITAITLVDDSDGSRYFLDFRSGQGVDSGAFYPLSYSKLSVQGLLADYSPGVVVTWVPGGRDVEIVGVADGSDLWTSFQVGDTYTAPDGLFSMTVTSATASTATVEVVTSPGAIPTVPSTTTVTVPPVYAGSAPQASVTVSSDEVPTGTVDIYVDGVLRRSGTLVAGEATLSLPTTLTVGDHAVRAVYSGAPGIAASESTATATVQARPTLSVAASARPSWEGRGMRVEISVSGTQGKGGVVTVSHGGRSWSGSVDVDGNALVTLPKTWTAGIRPLTVVYKGPSSVGSAQTSLVGITLQVNRPVVLDKVRGPAPSQDLSATSDGSDQAGTWQDEAIASDAAAGRSTDLYGEVEPTTAPSDLTAEGAQSFPEAVSAALCTTEAGCADARDYTMRFILR